MSDYSDNIPYCFDYEAMSMTEDPEALAPGTRVAVFYEITLYRLIHFLFSVTLEPGTQPRMGVGPLPPVAFPDGMPPERLLAWKALDLLQKSAEADRQRLAEKPQPRESDGPGEPNPDPDSPEGSG